MDQGAGEAFCIASLEFNAAGEKQELTPRRLRSAEDAAFLMQDEVQFQRLQLCEVENAQNAAEGIQVPAE